MAKRRHKNEKEYGKAYREMLDKIYGGNYIYLFVLDAEQQEEPTDQATELTQEELDNKLLYIGSTGNLYSRFLHHRALDTDVSKTLKFLGVNYKIYYAELDKDLDRDTDLYTVEYHLIHTLKPLYNLDYSRFTTLEEDAKTDIKLKELIDIAEELKAEDFKLFKFEKFKIEKQKASTYKHK